MFSYDARVFPLASPIAMGNSVIKARASLVIDETIEVKNFRIMETNGELWVSAPAQKASKPDPDTGRFKYYDEITFIDARGEDEKLSPRQKEIYEFMKSKYIESISGKTAVAKARSQSAPKPKASSKDAMSDPSWDIAF